MGFFIFRKGAFQNSMLVLLSFSSLSRAVSPKSMILSSFDKMYHYLHLLTISQYTMAYSVGKVNNQPNNCP